MIETLCADALSVRTHTVMIGYMIHRSRKAPGEKGVHLPVEEVVTRKGGITLDTIHIHMVIHPRSQCAFNQH